MRKTLLLLLASMTLWACSDDPASIDDDDSDPASIQEEFETLVPSLMSDNNVPGVAVGLVIDGDVVLKRGFGLANVEADEAVTAQTIFSAGELSTIMTGWGVLNLVAEKRMAIESPVTTYMEGWDFPPSDFDHSEVNLEGLLRHQSGASLEEYPGFPPGVALPTVRESLAGDTNGAGDVRIVFEPGSKTQYSSGGMTVIQLAIDLMLARNFLSYRTHVEESILRPLGIVSSRFLVSPTVSINLATPYGEDGAPIGNLRFTAHAAAGLMTTVEDMVTFAKAYMSIYDGDSYPVSGFERRNLEKILKVADGPLPEYEYGHQVRRIGDVSLVGQTGGHAGWRAHLQIDIENENAIVVLINSSNGEVVDNALVCRWIDEVAGVRADEFCWALPN